MKRILFLFAALLFTGTVVAQDDLFGGSDDNSAQVIKTQTKQRKHKLSIGPRVGGTMTMMKDPDNFSVEDGAGFGFTGGIAVRARFGKQFESSDPGTGAWGVAIEQKFKQNVAKTTFGDDLKLSYFEIPILVQWYPFYKKSAMNPLYIEAGVAPAICMTADPDALQSTFISYPSSTATLVTDTYIKTGDLKANDVRPVVGLGYAFPFGLDINARYYFGTSEMAKNFNAKINSVEFSLAWMFDIAKL